MGRPKKSKDPFADLDNEWKDAVAGSSDEDIKKRVADIALELESLRSAKKLDVDFINKTQDAQEAGRVYKEGEKSSRLRIQYAKSILEARGK